MNHLLLSVDNLSASVAGRQLFHEVTFAIHQHSKIALVGSNGAGKSTLLALMAKKTEPDSGAIIYHNGARVAYVPQFIPPEIADLSLLEAMQQQYQLAHPGSYEFWSVELVLNAYGFNTEHFETFCKNLSGGEANRALLAWAVIGEPDLLLLDEPTNHMDTEAILHFENLLASELKIPFCIISHDRELLDRCTNETVILRDERLYHFNTPLSQARLDLAKQDEAAKLQRADQIKEAKRLEAAASRLGVWVKKNDKFAARLQNLKRRAAQQWENLTFVSQEKVKQIGVNLSEVQANSLVRLQNYQVTTNQPRTLFSIEHFAIQPQDRIALLGVNGAGKSTFIRALLAEYQKYKDGSSPFVFNPQTTIGYYDQELRVLSEEATLLQHLSNYSALTPTKLVAELVKAGFPPNRHHSAIRTLSGGERARLQFLSLKLLAPTLLVLDEPTNHLDVEGIELLEEQILATSGAILFVSHDRRFVESVANRFWIITEGSLREISSVEPYYDLISATS